MESLIETNKTKKKYLKYKTVIQFLFATLVFSLTYWVWHYSKNDEGELKLYALQAIAEIIVAFFEVLATFLMIKSIKQNGDANKEMKKMNEKLQFSLQAQTDVLKQQQEFYLLQMKEKQDEIRKQEKTKILNRYLSYVRNFLFAYNREENFDGIDTKKLKKLNNDDKKVKQLKDILFIKLTPNIDIEHYIFEKQITNKRGQTITKIVLTGNDKDVKETFDCLLREYKYKLRTKLPIILGEYFKNFEENEELQEICG